MKNTKLGFQRYSLFIANFPQLFQGVNPDEYMKAQETPPPPIDPIPTSMSAPPPFDGGLNSSSMPTGGLGSSQIPPGVNKFSTFSPSSGGKKRPKYVDVDGNVMEAPRPTGGIESRREAHSPFTVFTPIVPLEPSPSPNNNVDQDPMQQQQPYNQREEQLGSQFGQNPFQQPFQ
jgi:hypothetical protein